MAKSVIDKLVAEDITSAYDEVESILSIVIAIPDRTELRNKLTEAKDALFAARVIADEAVGR